MVLHTISTYINIVRGYTGKRWKTALSPKEIGDKAVLE